VGVHIGVRHVRIALIDAVGVYLGNPNAHNLGAQVFGRVLLRALGSTNVYSASTVDQMPKQVSAGLMFGTALSIPVPDVDRCDLLVVMGANPYVSNGSLFTAPGLPDRLDAMRERGGRLVVIDPRRSETADRGAKLTVFPECALCGYCFSSLGEARPFAQTIPGPATEKMRAARHGQVEAFEHFTEARVRSGSKDEDGKVREFPVQVDGDYIGTFEEITLEAAPGALTIIA